MSAQDTAVDERDSSQLVSVRLPADHVEQLDEIASSMGPGWTRSDLIRLGIIAINDEQIPLVSGICDSTNEVESQ